MLLRAVRLSRGHIPSSSGRVVERKIAMPAPVLALCDKSMLCSSWRILDAVLWTTVIFHALYLLDERCIKTLDDDCFFTEPTVQCHLIDINFTASNIFDCRFLVLRVIGSFLLFFSRVNQKTSSSFHVVSEV